MAPKKRLNIRASLSEQDKKRYDGDLYVRSKVVGDNLSIFYNRLYALLFGGLIQPPYGGIHDVLPSGERRMIRPDIIRQAGDRTSLIEVKASSLRDRRPYASYEQIENYFLRLLEGLDIEKMNTDLEMAVFAYGHTAKHVQLHFYDTRDFVRILARSTHWLTILPTNLITLCYFLSPTLELDKSETKSRNKCTTLKRHPSWFTTAMQREPDPIDYLCETLRQKGDKVVRGLLKEDLEWLSFEQLKIQETKLRRFSSEEIGDLFCRNFHMAPFNINQFRVSGKTREEISANLLRNHKRILEDLMGVRDLYHENYEARDDAIEPAEESVEPGLNAGLDDVPFHL